jgi:CBS domain-containing protein
VVAEGKNPTAYTAELRMSQPVITVLASATLDEVVRTMEKHQIRRVPVVDEQGRLAGMISQADIAWAGTEHDVAMLLREVSRDTGQASR